MYHLFKLHLIHVHLLSVFIKREKHLDRVQDLLFLLPPASRSRSRLYTLLYNNKGTGEEQLCQRFLYLSFLASFLNYLNFLIYRVLAVFIACSSKMQLLLERCPCYLFLKWTIAITTTPDTLVLPRRCLVLVLRVPASGLGGWMWGGGGTAVVALAV